MKEGHGASDHHEQDYPDREDVSSVPFVGFALVYLRSHVTFCPCMSVEDTNHASFSEGLSQSEITDLEVKV